MSKKIEKVLPVVASLLLILSGLLKPIITGTVGGILFIVFLVFLFRKED